MKKIKTNIKLTALVSAIMLATIGCSKLDVVGIDSSKAFNTILQSVPDQVSKDTTSNSWSLTAPDDSVTFVWSENYSQSPIYDIMLEVDIEPFLNAGLDVTKLPDAYQVSDNKLMVGTKLGEDEFSYPDESTPLSAFEQIVHNYRETLGYHMALDHYNVNLSNGNMFEWAKNKEKNTITDENQDKDIVFVLNPEPFIEAGVDPELVEGWVYTTVNVSMSGKAMDVYKFLKPFDLQ